jgi:hypothetical protein
MSKKNHSHRFINQIKYSAQEALGFIAYHTLPRRNVVCLVSSMRAGSTLLKALLGQASDVSHILEYEFSMLRSFSRNRAYFILLKAAREKHLVLKKPRFFNEKDYPTAPPFDCKFIVLFRDVNGVVKSLMQRWPELSTQEAVDYWLETYTSILNRGKDLPPDRVRYTSYEKLLGDPKGITYELFQFIGSKQPTGVSEYTSPKSGEWAWGSDDGSQNIRAMTVQSPKKSAPDLGSTGIEMSEEQAQKVADLTERYLSLI